MLHYCNLHTCLNTLSKTSPLSMSRSDAQMANTLCSIYTAGQWSRARYLHYLQRTDGQVIAVTQPTDHLQCWGGIKSNPGACRCWQKQISRNEPAVYSSQLYSEMLSLQLHLQSNSHASFVPTEPSLSSRKHKIYWLDLSFSTRKRTDICNTYVVTSSLATSFVCVEITIHNAAHTGGDSDQETASKLGGISLKLCLAVEKSSSNLLSHLTLKTLNISKGFKVLLLLCTQHANQICRHFYWQAEKEP